MLTSTVGRPRVSFLVLSYNYADLIGVCLRSILDQTEGDLEIVVVDDASTDHSRDVIRQFDDPRIRLLVNERNLGGAGSYNRAVDAARGEFLVNLDADDWIAPDKTAVQLDYMREDPTLDILGTHVRFVDMDGNRHANADALEALVNHAQDLNELDAWVANNSLCRSSSMVRQSAHARIGLDDVSMVRAPDYELWTRALRMGCRFAVVPQPLTFYRLQSRGVTHADPLGSFLELSYAMLRNVAPYAEARALYPTLHRAMVWIARHDQMAELPVAARYGMIGFFFRGQTFVDYAAFRDALYRAAEDEALLEQGRRVFSLLKLDPNLAHTSHLCEHIAKLESDIGRFIEARDYWRSQSAEWEQAAKRRLTSRLMARLRHWRRLV